MCFCVVDERKRLGYLSVTKSGDSKTFFGLPTGYREVTIALRLDDRDSLVCGRRFDCAGL